MDYEHSVKRLYSMKFADADIQRYFETEPPEWDKTGTADMVRDRRNESFNALIHIVRGQADLGNQKGVITAYDEVFCDVEVWFDEGLTKQVATGLKDPHEYWCVHWECDVDEEMSY